jgi:hypothetical protein
MYGRITLGVRERLKEEVKGEDDENVKREMDSRKPRELASVW